MDKDLPFKLALSQIQGIGANTFKLLLSYEESAEKIFRARPGYLQRIPGVGPKTSELIKSVNKPEELGLTVIDEMERIKGNIIYCKAEDYPQRLLNCPDAPAFLFQKGDMKVDARRRAYRNQILLSSLSNLHAPRLIVQARSYQWDRSIHLFDQGYPMRS